MLFKILNCTASVHKKLFYFTFDLLPKSEKRGLTYYIFPHFYAPINNKMQNYPFLSRFVLNAFNLEEQKKIHIRSFNLIMGIKVLLKKI